jgi:vesicle-fusing ATPase
MPKIGFDASALALSFVPSPSTYTYHHLRRDIYDLCSKTGVQVDSRYVVPSSHLTIGRFINATDFENEERKFDMRKMETFIQKIEEINDWLEKNFWPESDGTVVPAGEWYVGEEKGLDCRMGRLWYGDGKTVYLGRGF